MAQITVTLTYEGGTAEDGSLDFYDIAQALLGFQRSLALTTHLVLNNEIRTQAPSLKGASIYSGIPSTGSWEITAIIIAGVYTLATAPKETPLGHLVHSAYDYIISETLGFHVNYDQSLGQQIKKFSSESKTSHLDQTRFDSLMEKCEDSIKHMHRPIVESQTAVSARIRTGVGAVQRNLSYGFSKQTFEYMSLTEELQHPSVFNGLISSYNVNSYKGRIYIPEYNRPVPFELAEPARNEAAIGYIVDSLRSNARERYKGAGRLNIRAFERRSRLGRLKSLYVVDVSRA